MPTKPPAEFVAAVLNAYRQCAERGLVTPMAIFWEMSNEPLSYDEYSRLFAWHKGRRPKGPIGIVREAIREGLVSGLRLEPDGSVVEV